MENMHADHGVNQVSELVREWNGSFSLPSVISLENLQTVSQLIRCNSKFYQTSGDLTVSTLNSQ